MAILAPATNISMANKSFSIYSSREDVVRDVHDQLLLEIGKSHIACIDTNDHKKTISAFELFNFTEKEAANFQNFLRQFLQSETAR